MDEVRPDQVDWALRTYPNRCPVLLRSAGGDTPSLERRRFLVPHDLTVGQFLNVLRHRLKLRPDQALYVFTEQQTLPMLGQRLADLYAAQSEKGVLVLIYSCESAFG